MSRKRGPKKTKGRGREVPMSPEVRDALEEQCKSFVAKSGREPGPGDPLFFDPDSDVPQPLTKKALADVEAAMVEAAAAAGIDPVLVYAMKKTGLIASEHNWHLLTPEDRRAWEEAVAEGRRLLARKQ
jgi:hypothetical protein